MNLHATCVALEGLGVLITGPSGVGKSDVALRLIDGGGRLVADDQVILFREKDKIMASPPPRLAGLIEARSVGLLRLPYLEKAEIVLCVELAGADASFDRLPEAVYDSLLDCPVRALKLPGYAASTPVLIRMVLKGKLAHVP